MASFFFSEARSLLVLLDSGVAQKRMQDRGSERGFLEDD